MYKEYREMSRTEAVEALYQDMAARHRSRFRSIHVRNPESHQKSLTHNQIIADSQGCRDREERRYQASLYQAASYEES